MYLRLIYCEINILFVTFKSIVVKCINEIYLKVFQKFIQLNIVFSFIVLYKSIVIVASYTSMKKSIIYQ